MKNGGKEETVPSVDIVDFGDGDGHDFWSARALGTSTSCGTWRGPGYLKLGTRVSIYMRIRAATNSPFGLHAQGRILSSRTNLLCRQTLKAKFNAK